MESSAVVYGGRGREKERERERERKCKHHTSNYRTLHLQPIINEYLSIQVISSNIYRYAFLYRMAKHFPNELSLLLFTQYERTKQA